MQMEAIELVPGKNIDSMHDEGGRIVVAGNVHIQPAVGELGRIDNVNRRIGAVDGSISGMLVEELGKGVESAQDADAGDCSDCDGARGRDGQGVVLTDFTGQRPEAGG